MGVLVIAGTVTVAVPDDGTRVIVGDALSDLGVDAVTDAAIVIPRLPGATHVLGPAALFYALNDISAVQNSEIATMSEVSSLLEQVGAEDLEESGLAEVTSPLYVERDATGAPVAACGYRLWPHDIAHLSVLVRPDFRGHGLARRVAGRAVAAALHDGLLPQWRGHPEASKAVARHLGLTEVGSQLSFRLNPNC